MIMLRAAAQLRVLIGFTLLASALSATAQIAINDDGSVEVTWGVKIPMRDGVHLNATLYRPREPHGTLAALFRMNPYTPDSYHLDAMDLARHGYAFAAVDVRGRGNSEGVFIPWFNDGRDGADVVEWLARQPWSNRKVGMFGESYLGRAVWSTLKNGPPHLAAAAPMTPGYPVLFWKNILTPDMMEGIVQMSGVTINNKIAADEHFFISRYREIYLKHLPIRALDRLFGFPSTAFQLFLDHPSHDRFWSDAAPAPDEYRRMNQPLLSITGLYDGHEAATLFFYREHLRHAPPSAAAQHYLVIGPWDHGGVAHPRREVGGVSFGPASVIDVSTLIREWFDFTLKGTARPQLLAKRVAYYVIGPEEWRYADTLDEVTKGTRRLFLTSGGEASDVFHSGRLLTSEPAITAPSDRWTYDPLDTRPEELDREPVDDWVTNQRYALNLDDAGVVYHSEPFEAATEMIGTPRLSLWISMDVADTDLDAALYLILPNATSILIGEDYLRARYRHSASQEELVKPGAIERYDFTFPFHSRVLPRGSRLRLVVRSPNNIYWEKNYGSGGAVADESGKDAHTAHLILYHDAGHPSALELPLGSTAP
jgi:putative CocE/NonD family hydrolase